MSYTAFFVFCFPIVVQCCTLYEVSKGTEICGDGKAIWTVGYGNRFLEAIVKVKNCNASDLFSWYRRRKAIATVGLAPASLTLQNNTHFVTSLQFSNVVETTMQNLLYTVRSTGISNSNPSYVWNISIKHCPRENTNAVAILATGGNNYSATYGSEGYFSCPKSDYLIDTVDIQLATNKTTVCGTCARWNRMERMDCWRVPNVTLNRSSIHKIFTPGDQLTSKSCNVLDYGKPTASVGFFRINLDLSIPLTLEPKHNNMTVYCKAANKLTQLLVKEVLSNPFTLAVEFGPTSYSEWTSCIPTNAKSGLHTVTVHVSFSANPPVGKPIIFVDDKKQNAVIKSTNGSVGCCGVSVQHYKINFTNVTKETTLTVEFNHKIQNLTLHYNYISANCSDNSSANLSGTAIAIICIGVVVFLILIAGFGTFIYRKNYAANRTQTDDMDVPLEEVAYENDEVHAYEEIREVRNGPTYENVGGQSISRQAEVYEYTVYGE